MPFQGKIYKLETFMLEEAIFKPLHHIPLFEREAGIYDNCGMIFF
jgi:hypothetical protein